MSEDSKLADTLHSLRLSIPTWEAGAGVAASPVDASRLVLTRAADAFVYVKLTALTTPA